MDNPTWARSALEAAKLGPYSGGAFGERSRHFEKEKVVLAKRFVKYLFKRCEHLAQTYDVYLMIDAGTTLYPLFAQIGFESILHHDSKDDWLNRLHITTNNLPGLENLINTGRSGMSRHSPLAIRDCHLLPGIPMPVFGAVGGPDTEKAIERFRDDARNGAATAPGHRPIRFIALVVGNWIRIRTTQPRCPVPMARGEHGFHLGVKNKFVACADEVHVISPLAKVFVAERDKVNEAMDLTGIPTNDPEEEKYDDVNIVGDKAAVVKLVSTGRVEAALLHNHSVTVKASLGLPPDAQLPSVTEFAKAEPRDAPHLFFDFRLNEYDKDEELKIEFPHERTHTDAVFRMFQVRAPH